ncbi:hypothetical protein GmHk_12G034983 [Glycine max]|nr:hypothetical protein GmHk_12G034983 [Glycine max]
MFAQFSEKVDSFDHLKGCNTLDQMMETGDISQPEPPKQVWCEEKQASVHEEIKRMNQLPANSSYVTHRLKVLNKILQLMSVQVDHSLFISHRELYPESRSWSCFLLGFLCESSIAGHAPDISGSAS